MITEADKKLLLKIRTVIDNMFVSFFLQTNTIFTQNLTNIKLIFMQWGFEKDFLKFFFITSNFKSLRNKHKTAVY